MPLSAAPLCPLLCLPGQTPYCTVGNTTGRARTVQHDQHFLPLGVAYFGSLAEKDLVLVTDKYSVQDELRHSSVREVLEGLIPADIPDELQTLQIDQGLNKLAV